MRYASGDSGAGISGHGKPGSVHDGMMNQYRTFHLNWSESRDDLVMGKY
jgi:hypothetical protein